MTLSGQFQVEPDAFPLSATLDAVPDARLHFVRVALTRDVLSPYFWVNTEAPEGFDEALARDPTVSAYDRLDAFEGSVLYRVAWAPETVEAAAAYDPAGVSILDTFATADAWFITLRFPDREALTTFRNALHDGGVHFSTLRLTSTDIPHPGTPYRLTPKQTEALLRAFERGYYDRPRKTTLSSVAADLDISQQALSDRLQRGLRMLLRHTVAAPMHVEPYDVGP